MNGVLKWAWKGDGVGTEEKLWISIQQVASIGQNCLKIWTQDGRDVEARVTAEVDIVDLPVAALRRAPSDLGLDGPGDR